MTWCDVVWHSVVWYGVIGCGVEWCSMLANLLEPFLSHIDRYI